jgi:methyltransferase (TIGR00027 family)
VTESASWNVAEGVGFTALFSAACRATETCREPHPLVRDPYAKEFVLAARLPSQLPITPEAADADTSFPWSPIATYVGVRSRFFDEFFAAATAAGIRQVVILAAGLDTRGFRLGWPEGTTVLEVDAPRVLEFKEQVLASVGARSSCARQAVAADLREDWPTALRSAGFNPAAPTAWLAEGLLPYLAQEARAALLAAMHGSSVPGSQVAIEHIPSGMPSIRALATERDTPNNLYGVDVSGLLQDGPPGDPVPWLADHAWSVAVSPITEIAQRYGRPLQADLQCHLDYEHQ